MNVYVPVWAVPEQGATAVVRRHVAARKTRDLGALMDGFLAGFYQRRGARIASAKIDREGPAGVS